ncbi:hypothetical protein [Arthrobacter rhizosphaerae]|uniref:hypothetical protein n=1 Tax=Arthrobacter rhizosphaerae TaxID=2855490 RepID=UPI001FF5DAE7|nr:hypothetical protein [Arthrobacter rhizosphaerae]
MKFNTILSTTESHRVLGAIVALRHHISARAKGLRQTGSSHYQFVAELDAKAQAWHMVNDRGHVSSAADGIITPEPEPPHAMAFPRGMPQEIQMLHPEALLMWGRSSESFYPVLLQEIGRKSLLITFEHVNDPAFRATAVVNRTTGIIEKMAILGDVTILTEVEIDVPLARESEPEFVPITDWIRPDY